MLQDVCKMIGVSGNIGVIVQTREISHHYFVIQGVPGATIQIQISSVISNNLLYSISKDAVSIMIRSFSSCPMCIKLCFYAFVVQ